MNSKVLLLVFVFVTAIGLSATASAVNILMADQMAAKCLPDNDKEQGEDVCAAYIRGFIDSAVATDPRVIENVTMEIEESFSQKAARTRVGSRLKNYGPSYYAQFCIRDTVPLAEVTDHVQEALAKERVRNLPARELVYHVLKKHYPCPKA